MEQTWRWFGDNDPVTLEHVKQAGATGIVTALHHLPEDQVWTPDEVAKRKATIEAAGLRWSVVESIPTPSAIKLGSKDAAKAIGIWKDSLANVGKAGVGAVCYNFMPVVDWTRTDLMWRLPTTGYALRFDMVDFVGYDVFVLKRPRAEAGYPAELVVKAKARIAQKTDDEIATLERNVIAGLPGGAAAQTRQSIAGQIAAFEGIDDDAMRANLTAFLREVVPVALEVGVKLAIHPDDPPFSLFGLPRVVSTLADAKRVLAAVDSPANGITLCTGSYGVRPDNDLVEMARQLGPRVNFAHLRNTTREPDGSFYEAEHLDGDTDMVGVVEALLAEERRSGRQIPMRPDHGHLLADDIHKKTNPGYSLVGRLKGLAELRGVMRTLERKAA